ncbi:Peroxisomal membrane protein 2 [Zootermopsis nevadensis]|uniref:Peroxisomal membrane protein 2 n=1 Tax=Zootermopsis nevadensis TaxID=136037 RepID=A0A067RKQ2_ZOONE|nr:Peroxisomal membrane protein 2 [Zootermopsis nevadensis]
MSLSKPVFNFLGFYFEQLHTNPVKTKSITSCVIATLGNLTSQYLSGVKVINQDSLIAYGMFGLLFGGSVPHYFYRALDHYISDDVALAPVKQLILERLIFMPLFQILALYMLARLEFTNIPKVLAASIIGLLGATTLKSAIFILATVKTSNPAKVGVNVGTFLPTPPKIASDSTALLTHRVNPNSRRLNSFLSCTGL